MVLPECATPTVTGLVGESAILRCLATGQPVPRITWSRDSIDVTSAESEISDRVVVQDEGETLIISDLMREDSGVYNCFVRNLIAELGSNFTDSTDVILEVQSELVNMPPLS